MVERKDKKNTQQDGSGDTMIVTRSDVGIKKPSLYKVLLHNDDYTPMDFVVEILEHVFCKDNAGAVKVMLDVHNKGVGVCGVYPYEIAETKIDQVREISQKHQYPLKCTMQKD